MGGDGVRSEGDKPQEVLDLHPLAARVFEVVQDEFAVPAQYPLALHDVDHVADGAPPVEVAAFAMRFLQIVRHYAAPGRAVLAPPRTDARGARCQGALRRCT